MPRDTDVPSHRILAIHAHPDDVEFQCAGALALLANKGHSIVIATMTPGDKGSVDLGPEEIAAVRRVEARRAAELIGAEYRCLEFRDLEISHDNDARKRVTEALRSTRPTIVLTASPVDYMSDHEITSRLVFDACFNASVPNYRTEAAMAAPPLTWIPHLYYMDASHGIDHFGAPLPVDFHIDVTSVFEVKRRMLACHASQRDWLLRQHGIDEYLNAQETWSKKRGAEFGVEHAEAFRQHLGHPMPQDNLLLSLLRAG